MKIGSTFANPSDRLPLADIDLYKNYFRRILFSKIGIYRLVFGSGIWGGGGVHVSILKSDD